jgi:alpha-1,2-mannosyltransferase
VWLIPALVLLAEMSVAAATAAYVLLCSSVVWLWMDDDGGVGGLLGGSAYVWLGLALLAALPGAGRGRGRGRVTPAAQ